jgi:hypothetical protein
MKLGQKRLDKLQAGLNVEALPVWGEGYLLPPMCNCTELYGLHPLSWLKRASGEVSGMALQKRMFQQLIDKKEESASGGARTPDPCLRRALLYPAELLTR